jgi:hypothetical protein
MTFGISLTRAARAKAALVPGEIRQWLSTGARQILEGVTKAH